MSFGQTPMGRKFFELHVPELIHAIRDVASALSQPTPAMDLPVKPDPDFLYDLYHGNYEPETVKQAPESSANMQAINAARNDLLAGLTQESREKLDKYLDALAERDSAEMQRAYESGFRTAVQMMVAGLARPAAVQQGEV